MNFKLSHSNGVIKIFSPLVHSQICYMRTSIGFKSSQIRYFGTRFSQILGPQIRYFWTRNGVSFWGPVLPHNVFYATTAWKASMHTQKTLCASFQEVYYSVRQPGNNQAALRSYFTSFWIASGCVAPILTKIPIYLCARVILQV